MSDFNYDEYRKQKKELKRLKAHDIRWDLALGSYLTHMIRSKSFIAILKLFFEKYTVVKRDDGDGGKSDVSYIYYANREDYVNLINGYRARKPGELYQIKRHLSLISFLKTIFIVFSGEVFCTTGNDVRFANRLLFYFGKRVFYELSGEQFSKLKNKEVIFFNSSFKAESIMAQICNLGGVDTSSMQHGMYFHYKKGETSDIINYENVNAKKLMCWGNYSYSQISKRVPDGCVASIYGYPFDAEVKHEENRDVIYVVLPRPHYYRESKELLSVLQSSQYEFIVKLHPSDDVLKRQLLVYSDKFIIDDRRTWKDAMLTTKYKAVIGFNTTAIFDALLRGQRVFIYDSGKNEMEYPGFDMFKDLENLNSLVRFGQDNRSLVNYYFKVLSTDGVS